MKKCIVIISVAVVIFLNFVPVFSPNVSPSLTAITPSINYSSVIDENITISAERAILMDKETGIVLFSKNDNEECGMASTTKIMTAIIIIENMRLDENITVTKDSVGIEGSSIYLSEGEIFTVESLLYGLLLESGNDVASALSIGMCNSVEKFVKLMNNKAKDLGMKNTNYKNPHGLSDNKHYTTARDLGILSSYALNNDIFRKIISTKEKNIKPINNDKTRFLRNHNKLLWNYEGITGIKTGYTKADGRCLVSSAIKDDIELICITLNSPDNWNDHKILLNKGFEIIKKRILAQKNEYASEISIVGGTKNYACASNLYDVVLPIPEKYPLELKIVAPPFVYAPVKSGDILAEVRVYYLDELIYSFPLCSKENIEVKKVSFFKKIFG